MGNALDFLNNMGNSKRAKRERYNKEARKKIEKFKSENKVQVLPDAKTVGKELFGATKRVKDICSIKSFKERQLDKKATKCLCCNKIFQAYTDIGGKLAIYCDRCSLLNSAIRKEVILAGGFDEYEKLKSKIDKHHVVSKYTTLYEVEAQKEARIKIGRYITKGLLKAEERIIEEAYNRNKSIDNKSIDNGIRTEDDFDF